MSYLRLHWRSFAIFAVLVGVLWIGGRGASSDHAVRIAVPLATAPPPQPYVTPAPNAVWHAAGYNITSCGAASASTPTLFTASAIAGRPGSGTYSRTDVVDAGSLDLRDGRLWVTGAEYLPWPDHGAGVATPRGLYPVTLLTAQGRYGPETAAALARFSPHLPVRWVEVAAAGGGTDAGQLALAGSAAADRLASVRNQDAAMSDIDQAPEHWVTPCMRFTLPTDPSSELAIIVNLDGDGGFPGAVGYDSAGGEVAVVVSTGIVPWSLLGLPGQPPPEAIQDEPTASTTPTQSLSTAPHGT